jgi:hypothetical protein
LTKEHNKVVNELKSRINDLESQNAKYDSIRQFKDQIMKQKEDLEQ